MEKFEQFSMAIVVRNNYDLLYDHQSLDDCVLLSEKFEYLARNLFM